LPSIQHQTEIGYKEERRSITDEAMSQMSTALTLVLVLMPTEAASTPSTLRQQAKMPLLEKDRTQASSVAAYTGLKAMFASESICSGFETKVTCMKADVRYKEK
jgi:hypothetical protein